MKNQSILIVTALTSCIFSSAQATSINVDGNLADWGLHRNGNINDWTPNPLLVSPSQQVVDDQTGGLGVYLTPGYGGQAYDAEALYTSMDNNNLYIALVTGLSPNTPTSGNSYGPGDFAIDFGRDGSFEFGIQTTGPNQGKVYKNVVWDYGLWDSNGHYINSSHNVADPLHPTSIRSGTEIGLGELIYDANIRFNNMGQYINDYHYVIEAAIPLAVFSGFSGLFDIHWTMNCANDALSVDPVLSHVPEPATLVLMMLGLSGLVFFQHRNSASIAA